MLLEPELFQWISCKKICSDIRRTQHIYSKVWSMQESYLEMLQQWDISYSKLFARLWRDAVQKLGRCFNHWLNCADDAWELMSFMFHCTGLMWPQQDYVWECFVKCLWGGRVEICFRAFQLGPLYYSKEFVCWETKISNIDWPAQNRFHSNSGLDRPMNLFYVMIWIDFIIY